MRNASILTKQKCRIFGSVTTSHAAIQKKRAAIWADMAPLPVGQNLGPRRDEMGAAAAEGGGAQA